MRERVRFKSELPATWSDFFTLLKERPWLPLQLLVWSEEECRFKPSERRLEIQIHDLGPLAKNNVVVIHANVRGDASFDFVAPLHNFKFEPDGTAELPPLINLLSERAAA